MSDSSVCLPSFSRSPDPCANAIPTKFPPWFAAYRALSLSNSQASYTQNVEQSAILTILPGDGFLLAAFHRKPICQAFRSLTFLAKKGDVANACMLKHHEEGSPLKFARLQDSNSMPCTKELPASKHCLWFLASRHLVAESTASMGYASAPFLGLGSWLFFADPG